MDRLTDLKRALESAKAAADVTRILRIESKIAVCKPAPAQVTGFVPVEPEQPKSKRK